MIDKLRALKSFVIRDPSQAAHADLEHSHWDAESHTWREHPHPTEQKEAA